MTSRNFILATAGHVDHGKTALVKALTGVDTDRLPEEKARGITIDLGFAHLALPGFSIGLIDVPGHEDFVRNMIAGVGSIDLALLVVAADDGWMPQTEEHLQILSYLGVPRAIIALTKADFGGSEKRRAELREGLRGTPFAGAPIVETSIRSGLGIELLKQTLADEFAKLPDPREIGKPRLFVDRVFSLRGTGTVVTGTLSGGRLSRGDIVCVQPQNLPARIRSIQSHNRALEAAEPATRAALNLPEISPNEIARGAIVTRGDFGRGAVRTVDVLLERSPRLSPSTRPFKNGASVHFHYGSGRWVARVTLLNRTELRPGEECIARLRFASGVFIFPGDRFIIRDSSGRETIGGGIVLDDAAEEIRLRAPAERKFLSQRARLPNDCLTHVRTLLERDRSASRSGLLRKSQFSEEEIEDALQRLCAQQIVALRDDFVVNASWWWEQRHRAAGEIDSEHRAHPDHAGINLNQLRSRLGLEPPRLFDLLLADLTRDGFAQSGAEIGRADHHPSLPPQLRAAGDGIRAQLAARPFNPPSRKDLAPDAPAQQALRFLCQTNEVVPLNDEVILSAEAFAQLKARITQHLEAKQSATVSELRQAIGGTRRILVPLLERLDRDGLTIRRGDRRSLQ